MPIREVLCRDCGHDYEEIVAHGEQAPSCPHCESNRTEYLVSSHSLSKGNFGTVSKRTQKPVKAKRV